MKHIQLNLTSAKAKEMILQFLIYLTGYNMEYRWIPSSFSSWGIWRFLVGLRYHVNSWVSESKFNCTITNKSKFRQCTSTRIRFLLKLHYWYLHWTPIFVVVYPVWIHPSVEIRQPRPRALFPGSGGVPALPPKPGKSALGTRLGIRYCDLHHFANY